MPFPLPFLPVAPLYAETHYRFRFFPSYLKRSVPEVIADAPHRLQPGEHLPILLLFKDAHRYPAVLRNAVAHIVQKGHLIRSVPLFEQPLPLSQRLAWRVIHVPVDDVSGWFTCDVEFTLESGRGVFHFRNDNHPTSSRKPLEIYHSAESLPTFDGLLLGEGHAHSDRTDDQVEFGVPLEPARVLSKAIGISFACITDHSYDLDDHPDDYLKNHHERPKWISLHNEIDRLNSGSSSFVYLRGEEVSCATIRGRNVHLLLLGNEDFIPGSGDSAEKWLRTGSEHTIPEVLALKGDSTAAFAAHARERVSFLQQLLLGRGIWEREDLTQPGLDGFQFANGKRDAAFEDGYRCWIEVLLAGRHAVTIAGDDAHGNFNRYRQIGIPFVQIIEKDEQLWGATRTGVFTADKAEAGVRSAMRSGRCIITDGPVMNLRPNNSTTSLVGSTLETSALAFAVEARSTHEFGSFENVRVIRGIIGHGEDVLLERRGSVGLTMSESLNVAVTAPCYLRAEAWTVKEESAHGLSHFCMTNPVWLNPRTS